MRTKQDYIKGLSKMKRNIYFDGQLIDRTDEIQVPCLNTIGTTYDEAAKPENAGPDDRYLSSYRTEDQSFYPRSPEQGRSAQETGHDPHALPESRRLYPALHGH